MSPKISSIISVYNGENYLAEAIQSALDQDYPHTEIIVVNDGSTDNTSRIIDSFGSRVIGIYQENQGLGAARNAGVSKASGDYLAFLDHDDLWAPHKLSCQLQLIQSSALDPLVFSMAKQFVCDRLSSTDKEKLKLTQEILPGYSGSALLISQYRFKQVGNFLEEKQVGEFIEWYSRALDKKIPVVMAEEILLYRRIHLHNMGRERSIYSRTGYLKVLQAGLNRRRALEES